MTDRKVHTPFEPVNAIAIQAGSISPLWRKHFRPVFCFSGIIFFRKPDLDIFDFPGSFVFQLPGILLFPTSWKCLFSKNRNLDFFDFHG